jgi:hypothetical protein
MTGRATQGTGSNKRRRRTTGSGTSGTQSPPFMDLKEALDSAKIKFEKDLKLQSTDEPPLPSPGGKSPKKSSSAPASPNKSLTVLMPASDQPKRARLLRASVSPRGRRSTLLMPAAAATKIDQSVEEEHSTKQQLEPQAEKSPRLLLSDSRPQKRPNKAVSMNEVIKLHQDEGVMHLLHALPASRRRPSATHVVSVSNNYQPLRRRPSTEVERGPSKGYAQTSTNQPPSHQTDSVRNILVQRNTNPDNILGVQKDETKVKSCSQEDLMTPPTLELLKQLPTKDYVRLWSSPSRYFMSRHPAVASSSSEGPPPLLGEEGSQSAASPSGSVTSIGSSASTAALRQLALPPKAFRSRTTPWRIQSKHHKDVLIRTYPSFAQVILNPSTTGLKHSVNMNVCDELIDVLKQLNDDAECRAILVTGMGGVFCQGVDLTTLGHDGSIDKQRRAAEGMAGAIKRLVKVLLSIDKVLVAAVNGKAVGLGVTILPYFDIVYASDKAEFSLDYGECFLNRLGNF